MIPRKYSRQRELIKEYLASTSCHPTADIVYAHIRKDFPNISLGTVYRNLNLLTELNEIVKIPTVNGGDRFDAITVPHYHLFCRKCGAIEDIKADDSDELNHIFQKNFDGLIESHTLTFSGLCKTCKEQDV